MKRIRLEYPERLTSLKVSARSKFYLDVRKTGEGIIEELIFIIEHLPEKQLDKLINRKNLTKLLDSILHIDESIKIKDKFYVIKEDGRKIERNEKEYERQKERVLDICNLLIDRITMERRVRVLTPKASMLYSKWIEEQEKRITLLRLEQKIS